MVSAAELAAKETKPLSLKEDAFSRNPNRSDFLSSSLDIPLTASGRYPHLLLSEKPESIRSIPFSAKGYVYREAEWRHFAFEELSYHCRQISSNRPKYDPMSRSHHQPRNPKRAIPRSYRGSRQSYENHAKAEQDRREEHRVLVITQYQLANDYALRTAGWNRSSSKYPTKEVIMRAFITHAAMCEQLSILAELERKI
jgi:hypothetical protein